MGINLILLIMVVYVWVYYYVARMALLEIGKVDPGYFDYSGAGSGKVMAESLAIGRMIFDGGLPKGFYPMEIKVKLIVARGMLAVVPFVFVVLLLLG